jgi:hypothetical protein
MSSHFGPHNIIINLTFCMFCAIIRCAARLMDFQVGIGLVPFTACLVALPLVLVRTFPRTLSILSRVLV